MKIEDVALSFVPNITPRVIAHLLEIFGSAEAIYSASESDLLHRAELREDIVRSIIKKDSFTRAEREIRSCEKSGIALLASTDSHYPEQLRFTADYPHIIYMVGDRSLINNTMLCALTGERESISSYGEKMAFRLLEQIAEIVPETVIVGALEGGVDAVALRAAQHFGLRCIGVSGSMLSHIEPSYCTRVAEEILDSGGLLISEIGSECKNFDTVGTAHHRVIAGLCSGVVVVEGSKVPDIARYADSYSRQLFALPGRVTDSMSWGANTMIASSMAQMVCSGRDIVEQLGWE